jgi:hypothetical protein
MQSHPYSPEREARVASALRDNLRRRKAQQQNRDTPAPEKRED